MRGICLAAVAIAGAMAMALPGCSLILTGDDGETGSDGNCGGFELLADSFDPNNSLWLVGSSPQAFVTLDGSLTLAVTGQDSDEASLMSRHAYDLRGSEVLLEFDAIPTEPNVTTSVVLRAVSPTEAVATVRLEWDENEVRVLEVTPSGSNTLRASDRNGHMFWRLSTMGGDIVVESGENEGDLELFTSGPTSVDLSVVHLRMAVFTGGGSDPAMATLRSLNPEASETRFCRLAGISDSFDGPDFAIHWGESISADCQIGPPDGTLQIQSQGADQCALLTGRGFRFDDGRVGVVVSELDRSEGNQIRFELLGEGVGDGIVMFVEGSSVTGAIGDTGSSVTRTLDDNTNEVRFQARFVNGGDELVLEYGEDDGDFVELVRTPADDLRLEPVKVLLGIDGAPGLTGRFDDLNLD